MKRHSTYFGFNRSHYEWNFCNGQNEEQLVKKVKEPDYIKKQPIIQNAEKQMMKTNRPVCTEFGIVNPLILRLPIKREAR